MTALGRRLCIFIHLYDYYPTQIEGGEVINTRIQAYARSISRFETKQLVIVKSNIKVTHHIIGFWLLIAPHKRPIEPMNNMQSNILSADVRKRVDP